MGDNDYVNGYDESDNDVIIKCETKRNETKQLIRITSDCWASLCTSYHLLVGLAAEQNFLITILNEMINDWFADIKCIERNKSVWRANESLYSWLFLLREKDRDG